MTRVTVLSMSDSGTGYLLTSDGVSSFSSYHPAWKRSVAIVVKASSANTNI